MATHGTLDPVEAPSVLDASGVALDDDESAELSLGGFLMVTPTPFH
jgi:Icc-related predicted phosphoesterase